MLFWFLWKIGPGIDFFLSYISTYLNLFNNLEKSLSIFRQSVRIVLTTEQNSETTGPNVNNFLENDSEFLSWSAKSFWRYSFLKPDI